MICNFINRYSQLTCDCRKKEDPLTALAIGSSIVGGIGNMLGTNSANETQMAIAKKQMEWQTQENQKNRDFQESMWNAQNEYNSPKNQRKLLVEGGFNPFVQDFNGGSSAAGSVGTPSMVGAPNMPHIQPVNPLQGVSSMMEAISLANQKEQVDSTVESNKANIVETLAKTAIDAYDKLGYKGYKDLMDKISPVLSGLNFKDSRSDVVFSEFLKNNLSQRYNLDMDSLNKEIEYNLGKKYGAEKVRSNLDKLQFEVAEIVGRLNTMEVQNEALKKQTAADMIVKAAHAFMLRKEGDKFVADTKTADEMRQWVVKSVKHSANIRSVDDYFSQARKESSENLVGYLTSREGKERLTKGVKRDMLEKSDALIRTFDKLFGEYIKVSSSGAAGSTGSSSSWSGSESSGTSYGW